MSRFSVAMAAKTRAAAILSLLGAVAALALVLTSSSVDAQSSRLSVGIATWTSADGVIELCANLRDASVGLARQCPERRRLTVERAAENRWLRSRSAYIAPEVAIWVRARRVGDRLDLGLGLSIEGVARGVRARSWSLHWPTAPIDQWQQTSFVSIELPVAPHPELWDSPAGIAPGAPRLEVGRPAPEFRLPRLGGPDDDLVSLSAARSGSERLTLIVFWSSWAPFVGETLSVLGDLEDRAGDILVVGVNVYEVDDGAGEAFIRNRGVGLLHLVDADGSVAQHYRVDGLPELFVLDSDGVYRGVIRGAAPLTEILSAIYGVE